MSAQGHCVFHTSGSPCVRRLCDVWNIKRFILCHVLRPIFMTKNLDVTHLLRLKKPPQRFGGRICLRLQVERRKGEPSLVDPSERPTLMLIIRGLRSRVVFFKPETMYNVKKSRHSCDHVPLSKSFETELQNAQSYTWLVKRTS
jgi:hypothetical protein